MNVDGLAQEMFSHHIYNLPFNLWYFLNLKHLLQTWNYKYYLFHYYLSDLFIETEQSFIDVFLIKPNIPRLTTGNQIVIATN